MAYLGKYIRQILSKKEAVVLPGFGSLILEEGKGIQRDEGRIDPPGAVIRFDATQPNDNGRLADEYAAGEQLDHEEARQQVLELVDAIRFKLDKGETYKLDLVGEFSRDDDNRIHFAKDPNWVIDPELFGLASLDLLELENEEEQEAAEGQDAVAGAAGVAGPAGVAGTSKEEEVVAGGQGEETDAPAEEAAAMDASEEEEADAAEKDSAASEREAARVEKEVAGLEEQEAAGAGVRNEKNKFASMHQTAPMKSPEKRKAQRKRVNTWRIIWIVAGSLIAVLALILLIPTDNGLEVGKDGIIIRNTEIGSGQEENTVQGPEQQQAKGTGAQEEIDAAARESLQDQKEIEEGPVQPPVQGNKYFVIAGSFQYLANATDMVDDLKAAGYPAEIILTENRLYRVSVKSFATRQEALNALPVLKSSDGLNNAWLLSR